MLLASMYAFTYERITLRSILLVLTATRKLSVENSSVQNLTLFHGSSFESQQASAAQICWHKPLKKKSLLFRKFGEVNCSTIT